MNLFSRFLQRPVFWVVLAFAAFLLLPSFALDYGLFEATRDERLAAMGWHSLNIS